MNQIARQLFIKGHVQGVGFRWQMAEEAKARKVAGWVENRADGTVVAFVQGERTAVDELVRWCWRGAKRAKVDIVSTHEAQVDERWRTFKIRG